MGTEKDTRLDMRGSHVWVVEQGWASSADELVTISRVLWDKRDQVLVQYEERLHNVTSPLVADANTREQLRKQATAILEDAVQRLNGGGAGTPQSVDDLSTMIGATRAIRKVPAAESLKAALILAEEATFEVAKHLGSESSGAVVVKATQVIYRCAMERVGKAATAYTDRLLSELTKSNATERRRISREMHDRLASPLAVLHHNIELYQCLRGEDQERAEQKIDLIARANLEALNATRELAAELRGSVCPEGLESALSSFLSSVLPDEVHAEMEVWGDESIVSEYVREELFLVVREAVRNAVSHANPQFVLITLIVSGVSLFASIKDDGEGFDVDNPAFSPGTGLAGMAERVDILGGSLHIVSGRSTSGTSVEIHVPLTARGVCSNHE